MRIALGIVLGLTLALFGCDGEDTTDAGPADTDAGSVDTDAGSVDTDAGPGADTWTSFASDFTQTYCVECHAGGTRDYNQLAEVRRDSATIICGVSPVVEDGCGTFPPPAQFPVGDGPFPSDTERERFVAWLNAGAPE